MTSHASASADNGRTSVEIQMVTFNSADVIADALASIAAVSTRLPDIDVTFAVLDNASSDSTVALVRQRFPDVRMIESPVNTWYGPACNELVRTAEADFVLLANPDIRVESDIVEPLVQAALSNPGTAAVLPQVADERGRVQPVWQEFPTMSYELATLIRGTKLARVMKRIWRVDEHVQTVSFALPPACTPRPVGFIWSTCVLLPRETAARFGPFSAAYPMYDTDLDLSRRMSARGATAVYVPAASVIHIGGASSTRSQKARMMRDARRKYYRQYHGLRAATTFALLDSGVRAIKQATRLARNGRK